MGARAVSCALALACAGFSTLARAQTLDAVEFTTSAPPNDRIGTLEAINFTDCVKNRVLNYNVRVTGVGVTIEVRTGTNCVNTLDNKVNTEDCGLVTTIVVSGTLGTPIGSQAIVQADRELTVSDGGAICQDTNPSTEPRNVTLNFMLIDSSNTVINVIQKTVQVDLLGPPPPKSLKAGVGEERLVLSWERPAVKDLTGYRFFCDPPGTAPASNSASTPQAAGAAGAGGSLIGTGGLGIGGSAGAGTAGAGAFGGALGSAGTDDASTSGAAGVGIPGSGGASVDASSSDGASMGSSCSSVLIPGQVAPTGLPTCGAASDSVGSGEARPLQNGVFYAVAVAAVDALGNAGPLSNVACATPKEVNDFFETYRNAGGDAGGGFCAFGARPAPGAAALLVAGLLLRRMRRRSARKNEFGARW